MRGYNKVELEIWCCGVYSYNNIEVEIWQGEMRGYNKVELEVLARKKTKKDVKN